MNINVTTRAERRVTIDYRGVLEKEHPAIVPGVIAFDDATFKVIYLDHVLEHMMREDGLALLRECRRLIRPDGLTRSVTVDLRSIVADYLVAKFSDTERSLTPCQIINAKLRPAGLTYVYDADELLLINRMAGYADAFIGASFGQPLTRMVDHLPDLCDLIVDARPD